MAKLIAFALIAYGVGSLLTIGVMVIGGLEIMMGIMLPIMLKLAPTDQTLLAWVEIPLSMAITARLSNVSTFDAEGFIGCGRMDFAVTMAAGGYDSADFPVAPALYVEEDAEIDEVCRYTINAGPLNIPSVFFWVVALGSLGGIGLGIILKLFFKSKPAEGIERDSPVPPPTNVQVMAMDETAFKE